MEKEQVKASEATVEQCVAHLQAVLSNLTCTGAEAMGNFAALDRLGTLAKEAELVPEHPVDG